MKQTFFMITLFAFVASADLCLPAYSSQDEPNTIQIRIGEFYLKPEIVQLKAGQAVNIRLVNEGKLEHEFMVGQGVKMEEGEHEHSKTTHEIHWAMSRRFERDFFEGIDVAVQTENGANFMKVPGHGTMVTLKPQGKATLKFKVPTYRKGEWIMACFMPGHYEAKMSGKVIVK